MTSKLIRKIHTRSGVAPFFAALVVLIGSLGLASAAGAQNPVPLLDQPLVPGTVVPGSPGFTLSVNGTGFVSGSVVHWNESALTTHFVDGSHLTADVPATEITHPDTAAVHVVNPQPGGGASGVVFFPIKRSQASVAFAATDFSAPGSNIYLVVADFNGDGKPDLAVTDISAVRILLGNGDGTFRSFQTYAACGAHGLATGDFNGDGIPDLAAAGWGCGKVSILLGNGDGTFTDGGSFSTGQSATYSVAVGDFNSDGKLDLATANQDTNQASVLLGNGDGTFQSHVDYDTGADSRQVATGDFNGDGRLDLAVSSGAGVSILLGNGDGTFQPQTLTSLLTPDNPYLVIADLNGDGKLDLAVANTAGSVTILLGNGDGSFRSGGVYNSGGFSATVLAADFNGDGILDLAAGNYYSSNVAVLLGNGDGTFQNHLNFPSAYGARGLAAADFNGDGRLDLAVANQFADSITVFQQTLATIPLVPTTTTLTVFQSRNGPHAFFRASVTSASGPRILGHVTFQPGGNKSVFNNRAGIPHQWPYPAFGTIQFVTAIYSGDKHHLGSISNVALDAIPQGKSFMRVTTSGSPSVVGQPVTITARVNNGHVATDGTLITFFDGQTLVATVSLQGGQAAFTTASLSVRKHGIRANFPGDVQFTGSHATVDQIVTRNATTTTLISAPNPSLHKQAVTFTVTVTSGGPSVPTGGVKFLDGANWLGSAKLIAGVATLTKSALTVGTHAITVQYLGDAVSAPSTSTVLNQVVQ